MNGAQISRPDEAISTRVAQQQDRALVAVQALLAKHGVRGLLSNTVTLTLAPSSIATARGDLPPELSVYLKPTGTAGPLPKATVRIGRKSTGYLVSIPRTPGPTLIEGDDPQGVVDLIMGAR